MNLQQSYEIMYQDTLVGFITSSGFVSLHGRLPYDLYLEECEDDSDIDIRMRNLDNFRSWCVDRILPLDREYAEQILNACAFSQAVSERRWSEVALAYNCLSLRDSYWVRKNKSEQWNKLNLFDNFASNKCVSIALEGKSQFAADPFLIAADCSRVASVFDLNHAFEATEDSLCLLYAVLGRSINQLDAARKAAILLGFVPRRVRFEQFKYGEYVQERLGRLSV